MTTYVKNGTGLLFRKVDPVGMQLTVTPETKRYIERGMVLLKGYGEDRITMATPEELKEKFTLLTEGEDD